MANDRSILGKPAVFCLFLFIAAGAFAFRIPRLDQRPLHTDEAVHAYKAGQLFDEGLYLYDRHDYHGPTIYWCAFPFFHLGGATCYAETDEWMFRIVPVLFGTGLILLLPLLLDALGLAAATAAALLLAVSPAFVFYSRYYIQEMTLVFFTVAFLCGCRQYLRSGRPAWLLIAGISAGLMQATKETSVLAWTAMAIAAAGMRLWPRKTPREPNRRPFKWAHIAAASVVALAVAILLLTNFLRNPAALTEAVAAYASYLHRSHGAGMHDHPFGYYLRTLAWSRNGFGPAWSEGLILALAAAGAIAAVAGRGFRNEHVPFARFLTLYTIALTLIYSAIPYKTPWCALTFLHGMALLAGLGAVVLFRLMPRPILKTALLAVLAAATLQTARMAYTASYKFYADTRNPYVYAHTSTNFMRLVKRIDDISRLDPDTNGKNIRINVITPDQWPLPWYLRKYTNVAYWPEVPEDVDAPIIITSAELQPELEARLKQPYQSEIFGLRPEVLVYLYLCEDLWNRFLSATSADSGGEHVH